MPNLVKFFSEVLYIIFGYIIFIHIGYAVIPPPPTLSLGLE
jgi:hypothetical protein